MPQLSSGGLGRRRRWSHRSIGLLAAGAVAGCGSSDPQSAPCTPLQPLPTLSTASPVAGPISVSASRERVAGGDRVDFSLAVAGPASFVAPCSGPIQLIVTDSAGLHVFADSPPAPQGSRCGNVTVPPGDRAVYLLTWRPASTIPPGPYLATFSLGDQPQVSVVVLVAQPGAGSPAAPTCG
jgi:hypothetical protein